jgi:hypothetical protein
MSLALSAMARARLKCVIALLPACARLSYGFRARYGPLASRAFRWDVPRGRAGQQMIARRGHQCGVDAWPHRFRHDFSYTWLNRVCRGEVMELNGRSCRRCYGASVRSARAS